MMTASRPRAQPAPHRLPFARRRSGSSGVGTRPNSRVEDDAPIAAGGEKCALQRISLASRAKLNAVSRAVPPPKPHRLKPSEHRSNGRGSPSRSPEPPAPPRLNAGRREPAPRRESHPPLSSDAKEALTLKALGILREQVEARVVHYRADLETSPELDAITAQVVQQVRAFQQAVAHEKPGGGDPKLIAEAHTGTLSRLLHDVFIRDDHYWGKVMPPISKRLAKRFFECELHVRDRTQKEKVIIHAEQALYYVLRRHQQQLRADLEAFEYADAEVREMALDRLAKLERDLQVGFLSRRAPELSRVMDVFTDVLGEFFRGHLRARLPQMAKITVARAATATQPNSVPYKIRTDRFTAFRTEWERVLMTQMIHYCGDELIAQLDSSGGAVREETLAFFTDPHVYSETCEVICSELYDRLCMEGFLDLPMNWRSAFATPVSSSPPLLDAD